MPHHHDDHTGHGHHHHHGAGHAHGAHGHHHAPASFGRAFLIGICLNSAFVLAEVVFGLMAGSTALLADAGHNLGDVLGLVLAWGAVRLSALPPSQRFSYGLRGATILAALLNGMILLVATGAIGWEAVQRIYTPHPVQGGIVMAVAAIGILINGFTAMLFARGAASDINIRGAFLHLAADAAVSAGVVISAFLVTRTGWNWLDPMTSLVICAIIIASSWRIVWEAAIMSLAATPSGVDADRIRSHLLAQPGVTGLHDLHIWPISTTETALTCHLVMPQPPRNDGFLQDLAASLKPFGIAHPTFQIEWQAEGCALAPDSVV